MSKTSCQKLAADLRDWTEQSPTPAKDLMLAAATLLETTEQDTDKWWRAAQRCQNDYAVAAKENARYRRLLHIKSMPLVRNLVDADMDELVKLHNDARAKASWLWPIRALQPCDALMTYAQTHAIKMAEGGWLKHSSMSNVLRLGFSRAGENIAWGQKDARTVMNSWLWSPGHRFNILSAAYSHIGCGARKDRDGRLYWCVVFGTPKPTVAP